MGLQIFIDGELVPEEDAKVSVFDHGLLYGDGVFEGIRVYDRNVFMLDAHLKRLYNGAKVIRLDIPMALSELKAKVCETVKANGITDGYVRLVITRGKGDLGLSPSKCANPSVIIIASTIKIYPDEVYQRGLKLVTVSTRRNNPDSLSPQIKSLNYLNHILAHIEVQHAGADEGLVLNDSGYVTECVVDNFFVVLDGEVITPPTNDGALNGITRMAVFQICGEAGVPIREEHLSLVECYTADECFLTGTAAEIAPVTHIDGRPIADGKPGPLTVKLMREFKEFTKDHGTLAD
ncbi:MAG: branched-chain-amino-acid transaminase [Candidatus Anoxymicrobium japonicum]|uniref:Branched-chain-amino-acid aminotransferase n=1 Tax=Candidatus Anoxymicrobium japonicum TaxID=2013648 RepID=A0A2N3G7B5_9ACTN|nr:MAG: branched-chain-amino-acid transaminase [Candidatus Anoxymicrobium japonicum]